MQATLPPVWPELERFRRRRGRLTLAELSEITARAHQMHLQELRRLREMHARLDWPRVHRPEILLYTPNQLRQLIRTTEIVQVDGPRVSMEEAVAVGATTSRLGSEEPQPTAASSWRPGPLGAPWHLPESDRIDLSQQVGPGAAVAVSGPGELWSWRGWGAGALLLVAALLLVRATDRCFTRNYDRTRRRRSEEWPTPNVLATSQHLPLNVIVDSAPQEFDIYPSESDSNEMIFNDLPPPYSECTNTHTDKPEDPPPPYSACYVEYTNPKDGAPSVRFLNSQRQDIFQTENTEELREIAHSSNGFNHFDTGQNPIGDRIYKLPYFDNETDSDDCNGECIAQSIEGINVGPAPIATQDMSIEITDGSVNIENPQNAEC